MESKKVVINDDVQFRTAEAIFETNDVADWIT